MEVLWAYLKLTRSVPSVSRPIPFRSFTVFRVRNWWTMRTKGKCGRGDVVLRVMIRNGAAPDAGIISGRNAGSMEQMGGRWMMQGQALRLPQFCPWFGIRAEASPAPAKFGMRTMHPGYLQIMGESPFAPTFIFWLLASELWYYGDINDPADR